MFKFRNGCVKLVSVQREKKKKELKKEKKKPLAQFRTLKTQQKATHEWFPK